MDTSFHTQNINYSAMAKMTKGQDNKLPIGAPHVLKKEKSALVPSQRLPP